MVDLLLCVHRGDNSSDAGGWSATLPEDLRSATGSKHRVSNNINTTDPLLQIRNVQTLVSPLASSFKGSAPEWSVLGGEVSVGSFTFDPRLMNQALVQRYTCVTSARQCSAHDHAPVELKKSVLFSNSAEGKSRSLNFPGTLRESHV